MTKTVKLTTRGRYAIMAMVELAEQNSETPLPLSAIAEKGNISLSYLEQLIAGLRRNGLVKSHRGPGGGYKLGKDTSEIFIADILIAAEDSTPAKRNANNDEAKTDNSPVTKTLWSHIGSVLYENLKGITLADAMKKNF